MNKSRALRRKIKFSIVTVCLNAENTILETIVSVIQQTYVDYEYIIWDGVSEDGTLEIIKENAKEAPICFFSEKDSGLYNAMNKAVKKCKGDYVLFLNSGDAFADREVLSDVANRIDKDEIKADLYFGNVLRRKEEGTFLETYHGKEIVLRLLLAGRMPCHQVIFAKTEILRKYPFDERYSITADYNFLMKCRKFKHTIKYIDRVISCFDCTQGISATDSNLEEMRRQDDASMKELYPFCYYVLKPVKKVVRWLKNGKRNISNGESKI